MKLKKLKSGDVALVRAFLTFWEVYMIILSNDIESQDIVDSGSMEPEEIIEEEVVGIATEDISHVFGSPKSLSSVKSLLNCANDVKPLTAKDEKLLVSKAQNGDKKSRNDLVLSNLKMIASIARRYRNRGLPTVDLMQEGIIGLLKCVDKFNLEKGIRFSTYGAWWVREAMTRSLSNKSRNVRIPVHLNEFMTKLRRVRAEQSLSLGRKATEEELALELGVKVEKVRKALKHCQSVVSLDQPFLQLKAKKQH